ncbi:MAG: hypothetical protein KIS96_15865, partial [Bauldia sp.]|nr:hypothetical protein [Bauldia sp.]
MKPRRTGRLQRATAGLAVTATLLAALHGGPATARQQAPTLPPDWQQLPSTGLDAGVSHGGHLWHVGGDGSAWRWEDAARRWTRHGSRSDFVRIDGAAGGGAAAIGSNGSLYVTDGVGAWRNTGIRAEDVGIGGGRIWLAEAVLPDGSRGLLTAPFDPSASMAWTALRDRVKRIDVDASGRVWAVDGTGALFVHADGRWIADAGAPAASDVGVGGKGSVYVVGTEQDETLGGGRLWWRAPDTGAWSALKGRLAAVTASADDRPYGVNSLGWVLAGLGVSPDVRLAAAPGSGTEPAEAEEPAA